MVRPLPKRDPDDEAEGASFVFTSSLRRIAPCVMYLFSPATSLKIVSRLTPLFVCLSLIPLILFFSLFSGWYIWKNIPIAWQVPVYLQYGDGSPHAELHLPPLSTTQPYDFTLQLVLPASEANFALGNFMTTLSLSTPSNKTLVTISRPAIALPPKPTLFLFSPVPRLIDLDVPLLHSYIPTTPRMIAKLNLGRKDGWKSLGNGEGRELSVSDAVLRGAVKRHGIRGLVSRFPLMFALAASTAFFSLAVITLAACILLAVRWRVPSDEAPGVAVLREDRPARVRKRSRRTVAGESRTASAAYKSEDIPIDIPSTRGSDDFPLKRRRSRMSDAHLDSDN